ncbi:hypothetical protein [Sulfurimonas sp.]
MKLIQTMVMRLFLPKDILYKNDYTFDKPTYMYMPWIKFHGDKLIKQINISEQYNIENLQIFNEFDDIKRKKISKFSRRFPNMYKHFLREHLNNVKSDIKGMIFTFDWHPAMRILSEVCEELNIPRILILHESVFIDQNKYYTDMITNNNMPLAEHIICWGNLQKNIFLSRGVNEKKLKILGAPKFDVYYNFQATITKENFIKFYDLEMNKKTILFAMQPMDMQVDEQHARLKQLEAINDIMDYCKKYNYQFILRMPPSKISLLDEATLIRLDEEKNFTYDGLNEYKVSAEDAIFHSDVVISINSTMLFEALLMKKIVLSTKYIEFEQIWDNINLPSVRNKDDLYEKLNELILNGLSLDKESWKWAQDNLSVGYFDGQSSNRISNYLENLVKDKDLLFCK